MFCNIIHSFPLEKAGMGPPFLFLNSYNYVSVP